jgi:hypothetical protein
MVWAPCEIFAFRAGKAFYLCTVFVGGYPNYFADTKFFIEVLQTFAR